MGIDFGERYIGLAIKKENLSVPYAHKVIDQTKTIKMGSPIDFNNFMTAVIHENSFDYDEFF